MRWTPTTPKGSDAGCKVKAMPLSARHELPSDAVRFWVPEALTAAGELSTPRTWIPERVQGGGPQKGWRQDCIVQTPRRAESKTVASHLHAIAFGSHTVQLPAGTSSHRSNTSSSSGAPYGLAFYHSPELGFPPALQPDVQVLHLSPPSLDTADQAPSTVTDSDTAGTTRAISPLLAVSSGAEQSSKMALLVKPPLAAGPAPISPRQQTRVGRSMAKLDRSPPLQKLSSHSPVRGSHFSESPASMRPLRSSSSTSCIHNQLNLPKAAGATPPLRAVRNNFSFSPGLRSVDGGQTARSYLGSVVSCASAAEFVENHTRRMTAFGAEIDELTRLAKDGEVSAQGQDLCRRISEKVKNEMATMEADLLEMCTAMEHEFEIQCQDLVADNIAAYEKCLIALHTEVCDLFDNANQQIEASLGTTSQLQDILSRAHAEIRLSSLQTEILTMDRRKVESEVLALRVQAETNGVEPADHVLGEVKDARFQHQFCVFEPQVAAESALHEQIETLQRQLRDALTSQEETRIKQQEAEALAERYKMEAELAYRRIQDNETPLEELQNKYQEQDQLGKEVRALEGEVASLESALLQNPPVSCNLQSPADLLSPCAGPVGMPADLQGYSERLSAADNTLNILTGPLHSARGGSDEDGNLPELSAKSSFSSPSGRPLCLDDGTFAPFYVRSLPAGVLSEVETGLRSIRGEMLEMQTQFRSLSAELVTCPSCTPRFEEQHAISRHLSPMSLPAAGTSSDATPRAAQDERQVGDGQKEIPWFLTELHTPALNAVASMNATLQASLDEEIALASQHNGWRIFGVLCER